MPAAGSTALRTRLGGVGTVRDLRYEEGRGSVNRGMRVGVREVQCAADWRRSSRAALLIQGIPRRVVPRLVGLRKFSQVARVSDGAC